MEGMTKVKKKIEPYKHKTKLEIEVDKVVKIGTKDEFCLIKLEVITLTNDDQEEMGLKEGTQSSPPKPSPMCARRTL